MLNSLPQPSLSWPQHPELFLFMFGADLVIYGMVVFCMPRIVQRVGLRRFTALIGVVILVVFCGYYLMYGIADPWEAALYHWMDQQGSNAITPATLAATTPSLEIARRLFLAGFILYMAGPVMLSAIFAIWNYRGARAQEVDGLIEASSL